MKLLGVVGAPTISSFSMSNSVFLPKRLQNQRFYVSCTSPGSRTVEHAKTAASVQEYKPGIFDDLLLNLFRNKLVAEVGWDSSKPGYDGLIEVANHLVKGRTRIDTIEAAVRVLRSLFPPFLLELYKMLIAPLGGGKVAAMMVARVTALTCQWLMGPCKVNSVDLDNGASCSSGVYVERCKYLEESKCASVCINTCKFPTQTFFMDHMGVPLLMEPNFSDYSCQPQETCYCRPPLLIIRHFPLVSLLHQNIPSICRCNNFMDLDSCNNEGGNGNPSYQMMLSQIPLATPTPFRWVQ